MDRSEHDHIHASDLGPGNPISREPRADGVGQATPRNRAPLPPIGYGLDIGQALEVLKRGGSITRHGWNGPGQRLMLQVPDENSKMTLPYIYIFTVRGDRVPWLASQTDILAEDWYELALSVAQKDGRGR